MKPMSEAVDLWDFLIYLNMKLFITNKKEFEKVFDYFDAQNFSSKEIHKLTYNQLLESVITKNSIPIIIFQNIDIEGWRDAEFRFKGINNDNDVYFYEFYQIING